MLRFFFALLASSAAVATLAAEAPEAPAAETLELHGGLCFDGESFVPKTLFVDRGHFVDAPPPRIDSRIDLSGHFLVPPFADAHTHNLSGPEPDGMIRKYLEDGVFYLQVLTNSARDAAKLRPLLNRPDSVDAAYANGGLTSTGSHPALLYEALRLGIYDSREVRRRAPELSALRERHRDAYWLIDDRKALESLWAPILETGPELIKIYLIDALRETESSGNGIPLDLVRPVVDRSRRAGLRVYAHVETAADFRIALDAGVDGFAHLPGHGARDRESLERSHLAPEDIRWAGDRRVVITPTLAVLRLARGEEEVVPGKDVFLRETLRALHHAGARIALGADTWRQTSVVEAMEFHRLGVFDEATLLSLWTTTTAQAIFPRRRIGRLAPGYEASLLALSCNPLEDFECVRQISLRIKEGHVLEEHALEIPARARPGAEERPEAAP